MKQAKIETIGNEASLLEGFARNDRHCMQRIYTENYKGVENYIMKNSGTESDAKDIFQEAIVAAWINVKEGKFTSGIGGGIGGYIFKIAQFKWLDKLKSKAHRSSVRLVTENFDMADSDGEYGYGSTEEEKYKDLMTLYGHLDSKCKEILNGFYYSKKSLEEIGEELGHDTGTIKTLKYRCMNKLRKMHLSLKEEK